MSIKPVDFHLTYSNTVRESKDKQIDFNRHKEAALQVGDKIQIEAEKNLKKTQTSEEAKKKSIGREDKENNNPQQSKRKMNKKKNKDEKEAILKEDGLGQKIDITI